ncbi:DoxX family protein [Microbacterium luticocti]|uniref:DoxX family protein n=1 Tax=Microbacterium luticocti TaxID=451764 RepID=UPI000415C9F6|nr:DoxX family protein [Microbacterium luticocti]
MVPLIILTVVSLAARAVGAFGLDALNSWSAALAVGLAVMFTVTAISHWVQPRRDGLIAIVPTWVPHPSLVVTVTGALELLGALGLLVPATRVVAAICLAALLVAMFPANVRAAHGVDHPAAPTTPLALRTALQVIFVAAAVFVAVAGMAPRQ